MVTENFHDKALKVLALLDASASVPEVENLAADTLLDILALRKLVDSPGDRAGSGVVSCLSEVSTNEASR